MLNHAIQINRLRPDLWQAKAQAHLKLQQYRDAQQAWDRAFIVTGNLEERLNILDTGYTALFDAKQWNVAQELVADGLALSQNNWIWQERQQLVRLQQAQESYEAALKRQDWKAALDAQKQAQQICEFVLKTIFPNKYYGYSKEEQDKERRRTKWMDSEKQWQDQQERVFQTHFNAALQRKQWDEADAVCQTALQIGVKKTQWQARQKLIALTQAQDRYDTSLASQDWDTVLDACKQAQKACQDVLKTIPDYFYYSSYSSSEEREDVQNGKAIKRSGRISRSKRYKRILITPCSKPDGKRPNKFARWRSKSAINEIIGALPPCRRALMRPCSIRTGKRPKQCVK